MIERPTGGSQGSGVRSPRSRRAAIDELQGAMVLARGGRGAGRVGPAAVRQVRSAGCCDRFAGGDRRLVGLGELAAAHERQRSCVPHIVCAQAVAARRQPADLVQEPVRLVDASRDRFGPRARGHRFAALVGRRFGAPLDQLERRPRALQDRARHADRAVVGARLAEVGPGPVAADRRARAARWPARTPPRPVLGERATPGVRRAPARVCAVRGDRQRLFEIGDGLVQRCDLARIGGRANQMRDGAAVVAGEPQMSGGFGRPGIPPISSAATSASAHAWCRPRRRGSAISS